MSSIMTRTNRLYRMTTNPIRLMPDFVIIGGQRCGTTSLYQYLIEHPGIAAAATKEVHFFDSPNFRKGTVWYRAKFPSRLHKYYVEQVQKLHFVTGEASPYYLFHPQVPQRVAKLMPQVKLIALLRNPVDRAYSQHWLELRTKAETLSFEEAVHGEEKRLEGEREKMLQQADYESYNYRHFSYLARGMYVDQLRHWMEYFPREQFLILRSEDLYTDPSATLKKTLEFLEMPDQQVNTEHKEFKQYREPIKEGYKIDKIPKMDAGIRQTLVDYFRPHNARLSEFLDMEFDWDG